MHYYRGAYIKVIADKWYWNGKPYNTRLAAEHAVDMAYVYLQKSIKPSLQKQKE